MTSIFSKIVSGDIPAIRVYEDDQTLAFMDISPATRGHVLLICKREHPDLLSLPPELLTATALATQKVARALQAVLRPDGINIIQNNGAAAGQTVFHYHVHIIPRWDGDGALHLWRPQPSQPEELRALAAQISSAIAAE